MSLAIVASAVTLPGTLLIYLTHPGLIGTLGMHGLVVLSLAVSAPILILCSSVWYALMSGGAKLGRLVEAPEPPAPTLEQVAQSEDRWEWMSLLAGGWFANLVLYVLVVVAYYRPIRLGATLLLTAGLLTVTWLSVSLLFGALCAWQARKWPRH
jgi:hypothetical protein